MRITQFARKYYETAYSIYFYKLFSNAVSSKCDNSIIGSLLCMFYGKEVRLKDRKNLLTLPKFYAKVYFSEKNFWNRWYGNYDFEGKTVLDVGAGAGETASFFFNRGAKRIVAIEPDLTAAMYFHANGYENNWNFRLINDRFSLRHLNLVGEKIDFMKMDIEGGEKILLNYDQDLPSCALELHAEKIGTANVQRIIDKFNLKPIMPPRIYGK